MEPSLVKYLEIQKAPNWDQDCAKELQTAMELGRECWERQKASGLEQLSVFQLG
jgi:hypothetical protein